VPAARGSATRKEPARTGRLSGSGLLLALLLAVLLLRVFAFEPLRAESGSMAPTLEPGDRVLVFRAAYLFEGPDQGDVVAFESPAGVFVKRVAGLPGDTVEIRDGVLHVNGAARREPYVDPQLTDGSFFGPVTVPQDGFFVLGDNRPVSLDSRDFGAVDRERLVGKVSLRFWPPGVPFLL
jgi:signal peptidase I